MAVGLTCVGKRKGGSWFVMIENLWLIVSIFVIFFNTGYPYDTLLPICNDIVKWALHVMVTVTGFLQHKSNKYECCAFHAEATWSNIATMIQNTPLMKTYSEALLEWNLHIVIYVVLVAYWLSTLTSIWNISVLLLFIRSFVVSTILIDIRMWLLNIGAGKQRMWCSSDGGHLETAVEVLTYKVCKHGCTVLDKKIEPACFFIVSPQL